MQPGLKIKILSRIIPTAANPVMTPFAPPAIPAAAIPFTQVSNVDISGVSFSLRALDFSSGKPVEAVTSDW